MIIRTNMSALRSFRERGKTTRAMAKNLEKLSSGLRINCAGDDAAGLSISEKMRANITELDRCQSNAAEGLDLARTADAALQEVNDMLCRARGLCIEAKNGTYSDQERAAISDELNQLFSEIDRITASSKYNSISLFRRAVSDEVQRPDALYYDETFTTLEPNQLELWGQMEFVKNKDFEPADSAKAASVSFNLSDNIDPNDSSQVLEGRSITIAGTTYRFTQDPTGISHAIDLKNHSTVGDALSALATSSPDIEKVSIASDGTVTLETVLKQLTAPVHADGNLINFKVPNGNGEYYNGTAAQNPLGDQTLGQIDGQGNINNPVRYSASTIHFDTSKLPVTLDTNDVNYLKANYISISAYYQTNSGSTGYASARIDLNSLNIPAGTSREDAAKAVVNAINSSSTQNGLSYSATCSSDGKTIDVTVSRNGYTGPMRVYMSEVAPSSSTTTDDPNPSHSWTSTAISTGFTLVNAGGMESGPELQITIPPLPSSGPFSFSINGIDHLYYNSNTHPLSNTEYNYTHYSSWPNYRHDTASMSPSDIQKDVIQQISNYYRNYYGSDIAGISANGNTITIRGNPNPDSRLPKTNLISSWTTTITPYKVDSVTSSQNILSDGNNKLFSQDASFSFDLSAGIPALAGKGFSFDTVEFVDNASRTRFFEFTNGPGTGVDGGYTDIDISQCTTTAELAAAVKGALSPSYNVTVNGDRLEISVTRNSEYYLAVTDGAEGIIADGSVKFSGGVNTGHAQASLDFSSINESNLDTLLGKGFRITCATCEGEYINIFFCWEDDGTIPKEFQRLDEGTGEMRTIHNIPVELSKVTSGEKIVESIVSQVRPSLTHYTDVLVGEPSTTLIAIEKRTGDVKDTAGKLYLGQIQTGVETNFSYSVSVRREKPQEPAPAVPTEDGLIRLQTSDVQIYVGAGIEDPMMDKPWYISVHLPYIDLKSLHLNPPEQVDLNAEDQDAADWLDRVDRANISISDARGTIGADYNHLEHALRALSGAHVELTDAESQIRDADMADLMMQNVKLQILTQSQQSMMAQANAQPQQVLQLLA